MNQTGNDHIIAQIEKQRAQFTKREQKRYKLDLLARLALRTNTFSAECTKCAALNWEMRRNAESLASIIKLSGEERRRYLQSIKDIVKHLRKGHKLVTKGQYRTLFAGIGVVLGAGLGAASKNYALGTSAGVSICVTIGTQLDKKAEKDGRVI